jgi:O-antigen/teichoic acid export membrane protein
MLRTVAAAAALNLVLNLTMIPVWGTPGAAAATLLTEAVRTALVLWYSRRAGLPFTSVRRFWRSALAGAGLTAVVLTTTAASWWSAVALGILAYGAALTLLGGLRLRRGALPELTV